MTIPQTSLTPLQLNVERYDGILTSDGIPDYEWYLRPQEMITVRNALCDNTLPFLRNEIIGGNKRAELAGLAFSYFVGEVMGAFRAQVLVERMAKAGRIPVGDPGRDYAVALAQAAPAPRNEVIMQLLRAAPASSYRVLGRFAKDLISPHRCWYRRPYSMMRVNDGTVTLAISPTIEEHARIVERKLLYIEPFEWVAYQTQSEATYCGGNLSTINDALLERVAASFNQTGVNLASTTRSFLNGWLNETLGTIDKKLGALLINPQAVPLDLWTGTAGSLPARLLRAASQHLGGHVHGHDHAGGMAKFDTHLETVIELVAIDTFVVDDDVQASGVRRNLKQEWLIQDRVPAIKSLKKDQISKPLTQASPQTPTRITSSDRPPRVMVLSTVFDGSRVRYSPLPDPIPMLDWHVRLLAALKQIGFQVIYKPHPDSIVQPASALQKLGYTVATGTFEEHINDVDVVIHDVPNSTTFKTGMSHGVAKVMIDFQTLAFTPPVRQELEQVVEFLPGYWDENARMQTDWADLQGAVYRAMGKR